MDFDHHGEINFLERGLSLSWQLRGPVFVPWKVERFPKHAESLYEEEEEKRERPWK